MAPERMARGGEGRGGGGGRAGAHLLKRVDAQHLEAAKVDDAHQPLRLRTGRLAPTAADNDRAELAIDHCDDPVEDPAVQVSRERVARRRGLEGVQRPFEGLESSANGGAAAHSSHCEGLVEGVRLNAEGDARRPQRLLRRRRRQHARLAVLRGSEIDLRHGSQRCTRGASRACARGSWRPGGRARAVQRGW